VVKPDPDELADAMQAGDLDALSAEAQRVARYAWARAGLDWGVLLLIGRETRDGMERLICTLQEDGSCYVVEQPLGWNYEDEATYVATFKARLGSR